MAKKLIHFLLITLTLTLGFGQLLKFQIFGLPIFLHDILIILIIPLFLLTNPERKSLPLWFKLIFLGLIIGGLRALTLFPLAHLTIPLLYSLRILTYLYFFILLSHSSLRLHQDYLLTSGFISLFIGLAQYFLIPDMRIFQYLGWDDHLSRLTMPHFDPTFSGAMLIIYFLFILKNYNFTLKHLSSYYLIFTSFAVLLTYARSVWLSLILTASIFLKSKKIWLLLLATLILAIISLPRTFSEGTNLLRTYSITSRFNHDLQLAKKINLNFIVGIGYNNLSLLIFSKTPYPNHGLSFNNSFLTILGTSGIIGLIGWLSLLHFLYQQNQTLRPLLIFIFIASFFNNLLLYPDLLILLFIMAPTSTSS